MDVRSTKEQQVAMRVLTAQQLPCAEIFRKLRVLFGDVVYSKSTVYRYIRMLRRDQRPFPLTSTQGETRETCILADRRDDFHKTKAKMPNSGLCKVLCCGFVVKNRTQGPKNTTQKLKC